jgi:hypothetical protein
MAREGCQTGRPDCLCGYQGPLEAIPAASTVEEQAMHECLLHRLLQTTVIEPVYSPPPAPPPPTTVPFWTFPPREKR